MRQIIFLVTFISLSAILVSSFSRETDGHFSKFLDETNYSQSLEEVLIELGDKKAIHYLKKFDRDSARMGKELVFDGQLSDGSNTRISKYFVCTDCHNTVLETDDPANESPENILQYSKKNNIPYLPASTFYGMYNKKHWYNGDYKYKYAALVIPTKDTLENAIQLCAVQCSQGRPLKRWEIRSILHYYKKIELRINDLKFTKIEGNQFAQLLNTNNDKALQMVETKYNSINDAKFGDTDIPKISNYTPNTENGEFIYKSGCLHCHAVGKEITNFDLSDDVLSYRFLNNRKTDHSSFSVPYITRKGTYAFSGRRQYMPLYTLQKMSKTQILDLMAFIKVKAEE